MTTIAVDEHSLRLGVVQRWRLEQLEAAGYPAFYAHVLSARSDVDLHLAVGLLEAACPLDTALRILL
jgi:hypothetical protein